MSSDAEIAFVFDFTKSPNVSLSNTFINADMTNVVSMMP